MNCVKCQKGTSIVDSRKRDGYVIRRHRCLSNERHVFTTYEVYADDYIKLLASEDALIEMRKLVNKTTFVQAVRSRPIRGVGIKKLIEGDAR